MMFAFFKIHITHAASLPTFYKIKISQMHRCLEMRGDIYIYLPFRLLLTCADTLGTPNSRRTTSRGSSSQSQPSSLGESEPLLFFLLQNSSASSHLDRCTEIAKQEPSSVPARLSLTSKICLEWLLLIRN